MRVLLLLLLVGLAAGSHIKDEKKKNRPSTGTPRGVLIPGTTGPPGRSPRQTNDQQSQGLGSTDAVAVPGAANQQGPSLQKNSDESVSDATLPDSESPAHSSSMLLDENVEELSTRFTHTLSTGDLTTADNIHQDAPRRDREFGTGHSPIDYSFDITQTRQLHRNSMSVEQAWHTVPSRRGGANSPMPVETNAAKRITAGKEGRHKGPGPIVTDMKLSHSKHHAQKEAPLLEKSSKSPSNAQFAQKKDRRFRRSSSMSLDSSRQLASQSSGSVKRAPTPLTLGSQNVVGKVPSFCLTNAPGEFPPLHRSDSKDSTTVPEERDRADREIPGPSQQPYLDSIKRRIEFEKQQQEALRLMAQSKPSPQERADFPFMKALLKDKVEDMPPPIAAGIDKKPIYRKGFGGHTVSSKVPPRSFPSHIGSQFDYKEGSEVDDIKVTINLDNSRKSSVQPTRNVHTISKSNPPLYPAQANLQVSEQDVASHDNSLVNLKQDERFSTPPPRKRDAKDSDASSAGSTTGLRSQVNSGTPQRTQGSVTNRSHTSIHPYRNVTRTLPDVFAERTRSQEPGNSLIDVATSIDFRTDAFTGHADYVDHDSESESAVGRLQSIKVTPQRTAKSRDQRDEEAIQAAIDVLFFQMQTNGIDDESVLLNVRQLNDASKRLERIFRRTHHPIDLIFGEYILEMLSSREARATLAAHTGGVEALRDHYNGILCSLQSPRKVAYASAEETIDNLLQLIIAQWDTVRETLRASHTALDRRDTLEHHESSTPGWNGLPMLFLCQHPAASFHRRCKFLVDDAKRLQAELVEPYDMFEVALAVKRLSFPGAHAIHLLANIAAARKVDDDAGKEFDFNDIELTMISSGGSLLHGHSENMEESMVDDTVPSSEITLSSTPAPRPPGLFPEMITSNDEDKSAEVFPVRQPTWLGYPNVLPVTIEEDELSQASEHDSAMDPWLDEEACPLSSFVTDPDDVYQNIPYAGAHSTSGNRGRHRVLSPVHARRMSAFQGIEADLLLAENMIVDKESDAITVAAYKTMTAEERSLREEGRKQRRKDSVSDLRSGLIRDARLSSPGARQELEARLEEVNSRPREVPVLVDDEALIDQVIELHRHHIMRIRDTALISRELEASVFKFVSGYREELSLSFPHGMTPTRLEWFIEQAKQAGNVSKVVDAFERMRGSVQYVHTMQRLKASRKPLSTLARMTLAAVATTAFVTGTIPLGRSILSHQTPYSLGHYSIVERIADGSYGNVSIAETTHGRRVAIKFVSTDNPNSKNSFQHAMDEIRILSKLGHPSVISLVAVYITVDRSKVWLVERLVDGPSCAELMEGGYFSYKLPKNVLYRRLAHFFQRTLRTLDFLHQPMHGDRKNLRVLHRDIKPANIVAVTRLPTSYLGMRKRAIKEIMANQENDFVVDYIFVDFNLSQMVKNTSTEVSGTPLYSPPEYVYEQPHGPPADLFALSLTGKALVQGEDYVNERRRQFLPEVERDFPELVQFVSLMWDDDPAKRAIIQDLMKNIFLTHAAVKVTPPRKK